MERVAELSIEVGQLSEQVQRKQTALAIEPGALVMTMDEAAKALDTILSKDNFKILADYWKTFEQEKLKKEMLEILKQEFKNLQAAQEERGTGRGSSAGGNEGGRNQKKLDAKTVSHLKDAKFSGHDSGSGWTNFSEDLLVAVGAIDKDLEETIKEMMDMKTTNLNKPEDVKDAVGSELWDKYSGELYARLMEITTGDAQKLVWNAGAKSKRCGFWAMRKLQERFNPRSYTRLLKMLLAVIKPRSAKGAKDVQAAVEDWESTVAKLEEEYGETINDCIKVAILLSIVPETLQEKTFEIEKRNKRGELRRCEGSGGYDSIAACGTTETSRR